MDVIHKKKIAQLSQRKPLIKDLSKKIMHVLFVSRLFTFEKPWKRSKMFDFVNDPCSRRYFPYIYISGNMC